MEGYKKQVKVIESVNIKNFKSIVDLTLPLSNINVFIGENGCGKSNILEAIGFAGEASVGNFTASNLYYRGIRNAKPSLIFNSFSNQNEAKEVAYEFDFTLLGAKWKVKDSLALKEGDQNKAFPEWVYKSQQSEVDIEHLDADREELRGIKNSIPNIHNKYYRYNYVIYSPHSAALRGLSNISQYEPVGINGENIDILINSLNPEEKSKVIEGSTELIGWLDEFFVDANPALKMNGYRANRGNSKLYFKDKFMAEENNIFSAENANEGVLHVLFYLALMVSKDTPPFFAIDNIETGINPKLLRRLMRKISELAIEHEKQVLITTHNPAALDGLNLHDDRQRLFIVNRNDDGHTVVDRLKLKPHVEGEKLKLSEMWMRGFLGGLPTNF
jgi:predicted ATPase